MKFSSGLTADNTCLNVANTCFCNYYLIEKHTKTYAAHFFNVALLISILLINKSVFSLYGSTIYPSINYPNSNSFSLTLFPFLFYTKKWLPKIYLSGFKKKQRAKLWGDEPPWYPKNKFGSCIFKKSFKKCYDRIGIEHICGSGQEMPL